MPEHPHCKVGSLTAFLLPCPVTPQNSGALGKHAREGCSHRETVCVTGVQMERTAIIFPPEVRGMDTACLKDHRNDKSHSIEAGNISNMARQFPYSFSFWHAQIEEEV